MDAFVVLATGLTLGVNRLMEVVKAFLDRQTTASDETRKLVLMVAQPILGIGSFAVAYATKPILTGTWLDAYPVLIIFLGGMFAAYGSDVAYQALSIFNAIATLFNKPVLPPEPPARG